MYVVVVCRNEIGEITWELYGSIKWAAKILGGEWRWWPVAAKHIWIWDIWMILGWVGIYLCYFGKKIYTCMQAPQLLSAVRGAGLQDAAGWCSSPLSGPDGWGPCWQRDTGHGPRWDCGSPERTQWTHEQTSRQHSWESERESPVAVRSTFHLRNHKTSANLIFNKMFFKNIELPAAHVSHPLMWTFVW